MKENSTSEFHGKNKLSLIIDLYFIISAVSPWNYYKLWHYIPYQEHLPIDWPLIDYDVDASSHISSTLWMISFNQNTCRAPNNPDVVSKYQRNHSEPGLCIMHSLFLIMNNPSNINLYDMNAHPTILNAKNVTTNAAWESVTILGSRNDSGESSDTRDDRG